MSTSSGGGSRKSEAAQARAAERAHRAQRQRRIKWISSLAVAGLVLLGLGAWAMVNVDVGGPEPATEENLSQEETVLAYFQCLRDHGLDVDDPDPSSGGIAQGGPDSSIDFEDPAVQAILETCREATGGGPMQGGNMGENMAETEALFNFVTCMQDHGIDMPDPDADGNLSIPEGLDPQSAEFQAARDACVEHLAGGGVRIQGPGGGPRGAGR